MFINSIPTSAVAAAIWANATRTLTSDVTIPAQSGDDSGVATVSVVCGNGVKGSWAQVVAATTRAVTGIVLQMTQAGTRTFIDVGTGAAASEVVRIGNITNSTVNPCNLYIPFSIPAGTRVALRGQDGASATIGVGVQLLEP